MEKIQPYRAILFIDGQNLFHHAKVAFGHQYPNYDPKMLSQAVCRQYSWHLQEVRFYTGLHSREMNSFWHQYWMKRFLFMERQGISVTKLPLKYSHQPDGPLAREKGIDVRIALDIVRLARQDKLDVVLLFSQDQDLSQVAIEIRNIATEMGRYIKIVSAFPYGDKASSLRGVDKTDWFKMDRAFYDACLDPNDYRPRQNKTAPKS